MEIKRYVNLIFGLLAVALSFNLFFEPNNLVPGGVSGLSIVTSYLFSINTSIFILIANIILIILSYIFLGHTATKNTIIGSILLPLIMDITLPLTNLINLQNIDVIIQATLGGALSGFGYGLIFKSGFTSGGTDILNAIVSKYAKIPLNTSILIVDGLIVLCGGLVFGIESMIYSFIILVLISYYSNRSMLGIGDDKILLITSSKSRQITSFLANNYSYGITILKASGGYSNTPKNIIMISVKSSFYTEIKQQILLIDPNSFICVYDSYETIYPNKEKRKSKRKQKELAN